MTGKPELKVVGGPKRARRTPAKKASATRRKPTRTVSQAASNGTHLDLLMAMRTRIAKSVEDVNTPARDLAALSRRLMEIAKEIEAIKAAELQEAAEDDDAPDEEFGETAI